MLRFSTRGLALYIAFVSLTLALTRAEFVLGGVILGSAIVVANFLVPIRVWRFVTYGVMTGIVAGVIILDVVIYLRYGNLSRRRLQPGELEFFLQCRPFAFHLGALTGGTVGLLISKERTRS